MGMKWISVNELLPPPKQIVAIVDGHGCFGIAYAYNWKWYEGNYTYSAHDDEPIYVTHWMPLPEPPEEEE